MTIKCKLLCTATTAQVCNLTSSVVSSKLDQMTYSSSFQSKLVFNSFDTLFKSCRKFTPANQCIYIFSSTEKYTRSALISRCSSSSDVFPKVHIAPAELLVTHLSKLVPKSSIYIQQQNTHCFYDQMPHIHKIV